MTETEAAASVILGDGPASDDRPARAVLYGPPGAGKSSLLARLLTEAGTPAPDWLADAVAGFDGVAGEVESGGLAFADAPEGVTPDQTTDVLLVVLPTTLALDPELLAPVRPLFTAGVPVLWVLARCDDAFPDIGEDPSRYRSRADRLRAELVHRLRRAGLPVEPAAVHPVAADPDGLTSMGLREDRTRLAEVAGTADRGRVRVELARARAADEIARAEAEQELLAGLATSFGGFLADLETYDRGARDSLRGELIDRISDLSRTTASADDLAAALERDLSGYLPQWRRTWGGYLEDLAGRAAAALPAALFGELEPKGLAEHVPDWPARTGGKLDRGKVVDVLKGKGGLPTRVAVDVWSIGKHGAWLSRVKNDLDTGGRLASGPDVAAVTRFTQRADAVVWVAPYVIEALLTVVGHRLSRQAERDQADRAEQRAAAVLTTARKIADHLATDGDRPWAAAVATMRAILAEAVPDPARVAAARSRLSDLRAAAAVLSR
jgi:hypothetical protein